MFKSKAKMIAVTFIIFVVSILFFNSNYAKYSNLATLDNNETTDWKVTITNDTRDLKDTQEISFKVEDNPNVVARKIAPGCKAIATIEVDLIGTRVPVEIKTLADESALPKFMKLSAKIDGKSYTLGTTKVIELENNSAFTEENGRKVIKLELEWINNDNNNDDTIIGMSGKTIKIPITINVTQHI